MPETTDPRTNLADVLATWNSGTLDRAGAIEIDDDTLRDGLQGAFVRQPTLDEKATLLRDLASIGVDYTIVGFPAISAAEEADCAELVAVVEREKLSVKPKCLARAHAPDLEAVARLNDRSSVPVFAEVFLGSSPLRRLVEQWTIEQNLGRIAAAGTLLAARGVPWGLSIEDATRTPPKDLERFVAAGIDAGASQLTVCDTAGDAHPDGARRILEFVRERATRSGASPLLLWHGHDDKGLGVANSIAALHGGADCVSGSFLGLGERAGNTALERVLFHLHELGSRRFRLERIVPFLHRLAEFTRTPLPPTAPLVGAQAFATTAGTHAAAILKARKLGREFEDLVFSGVPAAALGRSQDVLLGPTSGLTNARYALDALADVGAPADPDAASRALLDHAKTLDRWMTIAEIRAFAEANLKLAANPKKPT